MLISLDCREQYLIQECRRYLSGKSELAYIKLEEKSLPIGDIIVYDDNKEEKIIIERKTMRDLASSIRDNRYSEQSFRLDECKLHNHNIYYLIEGTLQSLGPRFDRKTVLSAITSISYHKGFSLYRTFDVVESAEWLIRVADKLHRANKPSYYSNECIETNESESKSYSAVCKRVKKNNITNENIGEIMLMQIPGVSPQSAITILKHFSTLKNLIKTLEQDPSALNDIKQLTKTGKERNINKTTKTNIYNYLVATQSGVINVKTD